jgi:hypothetical protein
MSSHVGLTGSGPWLRPVIIGALSLVALIAVEAAIDPFARVVALLLFMIFGPGLALVGLLGIRDVWRELSLIIGVSLALDLVVVSALVYGGIRSSEAALVVLVGIAVAGAVGQFVSRARGAEVAS